MHSVHPMRGNCSSSSMAKGASSSNGSSYLNSKSGRSHASYQSYSKPSYSTSSGLYQASKSRALPAGPGPLPNKPSMDTYRHRYVAAHSDRKQTERTERTRSLDWKPSNDSEYGSTSGMKSNFAKTDDIYVNNRRSNLTSSGRKSQSLTNLHHASTAKSESSAYLGAYNPSKYQGSSRYHDHGQNSSTSCKTYSTDSVGSRLSHSDLGRSRLRTDREPFPSSNGIASVERGSLRAKEVITASPSELKMSSRRSSQSSSCSSPPIDKRSSDGLVGLRNLGNTCFMNSVLQCLSHTRPLTDVILKGSRNLNVNSKSSMKGKLFQAFADLIKLMWKSSNADSALSPHSFKTQIQRFAPRFVGYNQQDAQEFLRFLLEGLHDDVNEVKNKPQYRPCEFKDSLSDRERAEKFWEINLARDNSVVTDIFVGQLKSTLKCCTCGYKSVTFDPFWDLSLPIPRRSYSSRRRSYGDDVDVTLVNCMQLFTKEEELDGDERPTCEKCKTKRKSTKKFTIQRFPRILVLHLKRFSGFGFRSKLQTNVEFPHTLDLGDFAADSRDGRGAQYNLYAVSNHSGTTYGGHYTAYCRHPYSGDWHCFNDSSVDPVSSSRVRGSQTYILFYEKTQTKSSL